LLGVYQKKCGKRSPLTGFRVLIWVLPRRRPRRPLSGPGKGGGGGGGGGLPSCPAPSRGTTGAANGRAGEQYQVKVQYEVRANTLLSVVLRIRLVDEGKKTQ